MLEHIYGNKKLLAWHLCDFCDNVSTSLENIRLEMAPMQANFCNISCEICIGSAGFNTTSSFWALEFQMFLQPTLDDVMEHGETVWHFFYSLNCSCCAAGGVAQSQTPGFADNLKSQSCLHFDCANFLIFRQQESTSLSTTSSSQTFKKRCYSLTFCQTVFVISVPTETQELLFLIYKVSAVNDIYWGINTDCFHL